MKPTNTLLVIALFFMVAAQAPAAIIAFDLKGTAGDGLLPGNEPGSITGGTGGEIGAGITYDTVTNILDLTNVGWGSSQGAFADLTSLANNSHIHGPVTLLEASTFTGTAGILVNLTRSSSAVTGGTFTNAVDLDTVFGVNAETREAELLAGRWYINLHTVNNGGGEMRGFLVAVPEPSRALLSLLGLGAIVGRRRRPS